LVRWATRATLAPVENWSWFGGGEGMGENVWLGYFWQVLLVMMTKMLDGFLDRYGFYCV
jgi:hypothetical protein